MKDYDVEPSDSSDSTQKERPPKKVENMEFIEKLLLGKLGLPITFWVYGVLAAIVWFVLFVSVLAFFGSLYNTVIHIGFSIYLTLALISVWIASNEYNGPTHWAILSKFFVVVMAIPVLVSLIKKFGSQI